MDEIKAAHPKARHHCYAYRCLERDEITEFASDAGEPSGSAGQPILGELRRNELINICVIVVRYFGGTKLGIPGLIHAYREGTRMALTAAELVTVMRTVGFIAEMPIALQPKFYAACKQEGLEIEQPEYHHRFSAFIRIPLRDLEVHVHQLLSRVAGQEGDPDQLCAWLDMTLQQKENPGG